LVVVRARILVVDDDRGFAADVRGMLDADVDELAPGVDLVEAVREARRGGRPYDVVLVDYLASRGGMHAISELVSDEADSRVILSASRDLGEVGVESMRAGVFDFLAKPVGRAELRLRVERAVRDVRPDLEGGGNGIRRPRKDDVIVGGGAWIKELYERISMAAPTDVTVAIYGESGTGKELVARTIHNLSNRHRAAFVVVNCAAIPEGLLEDELFGHVRGAFTDASRDREGLVAAADGGTLFLDEIAEMPLGLQAKLLRVIQGHEFRRIGDDRDRRVDVRFITATNQHIEEAVRVGRFRQDLYYRINVFPLRLPPLRERREDIPLLAHHFLLKHRTKVGKRIEGFTPAALAKLAAHDYPGNVRELENRVHHALVMAQGEQIDRDDVQLGNGISPPLIEIDLSRPFRELKRQVVESFESEYVRALLDANHGNLAAAARQAGMDRKNLWSFVRKYDIDLDQLRHRRS
jgi:DNA-binding NtrC family response regulator